MGRDPQGPVNECLKGPSIDLWAQNPCGARISLLPPLRATYTGGGLELRQGLEAPAGVSWALKPVLAGEVVCVSPCFPREDKLDTFRHSKDLTRPFNSPLSTIVGPLMTGMDPLRHDTGPPSSCKGPLSTAAGSRMSGMGLLRHGTDPPSHCNSPLSTAGGPSMIDID